MKFLASVFTILAAGLIALGESGSEWIEKNSAALAGINRDTLAALAESPAGMDELIGAAAKSAYTADAAQLTRLAALSQHLMTPGHGKARRLWADKLLAAATAAQEPYIQIFFLDQLRWVGYRKQARAVKALGDASTQREVREFSDLLVRTLEEFEEPALAIANKYATLRQELLKLSPGKRSHALLRAFDDSDTAIAGLATELATTTGGKKETALWLDKLAATTAPERKVLLLDMLGKRRDTSALAALPLHMLDSDQSVAAAAQRAMRLISQVEFARKVPAVLRQLPMETRQTTLSNLRQLPTGLLRDHLLPEYPAFSEGGQLTVLTMARERKIKEAAPLAIGALRHGNDQVAMAGWRLLRIVGGDSDIDQLIESAIGSNARVASEAQVALAAIARRASDGNCVKALARGIRENRAQAKATLMQSAALLGGGHLLKEVRAEVDGNDPESATAAIRALAAWDDVAALPALLQLALNASDKKGQILAMRGIERLFKLNAATAMTQRPAWQALANAGGNPEHRKAIDDLFSK